jgi:hypothetical protein
MQVPLWILGAGALVAGFAWAEMIHGFEWFPRQLEAVVGPAQALLAHGEHRELNAVVLAFVGVGAAIVGISLAFVLFRSGAFKESSNAPLGGFARGWTLAFDGLHAVAGIWPVRILSWILDKICQPLLSGAVRLFAYLVQLLGAVAQWIQRSRLRVNLAMSAFGLLVVLIILSRDIL